MGKVIHSNELIEMLAQQWDRGIPVAKIGANFGLSKNKVIGIASRNKDRFTPRVKILKPVDDVPPPPPKKPMAIKPLAKATEAPAPDGEARNCQLVDLGPGQCKWPVNGGGPYLFCGRGVDGHGNNYCAHHHWRSLQ